MSSSVMLFSSPRSYSHIGGTGVHLCHILSPFVTRTAAKYLLYCSLEKIKPGVARVFQILQIQDILALFWGPVE